MYMPLGVDNSWDFEEFKQDFRIHINKLTKEMMEFDVIGVDPAIANALRRILIAEVPTVCIEHVFMVNNTSIIQVFRWKPLPTTSPKCSPNVLPSMLDNLHGMIASFDSYQVSRIVPNTPTAELLHGGAVECVFGRHRGINGLLSVSAPEPSVPPQFHLNNVMVTAVFVKAQIGPNFGKCDPHGVLYDGTSGLHGGHILALAKSVLVGLVAGHVLLQTAVQWRNERFNT
jgi:hypothetical protein